MTIEKIELPKPGVAIDLGHSLQAHVVAVVVHHALIGEDISDAYRLTWKGDADMVAGVKLGEHLIGSLEHGHVKNTGGTTIGSFTRLPWGDGYPRDQHDIVVMLNITRH